MKDIKKRVSVVIPTYNGLHLLQKHLPAVIASLSMDDEMIIVDDCSSDTTVETLTRNYRLTKDVGSDSISGSIPSKKIGIKVVSTTENLRFAGACNLGVSHASNGLIFLLNNDVSPKNDVLSVLVPHFDDPECFAVGCKEYENTEEGIASGKNILWFERGRFMHKRDPQMHSGETAWVSGGSGVFDKNKWVLLGGFDKRFYPAYWEDIDLSFRARKKGWKVLFEERAIVLHKHESTHKDVFGSKKIEKISFKNGELFTIKHATLRQYLQFLLWRPYWLYKQLQLFF